MKKMITFPTDVERIGAGMYRVKLECQLKSHVVRRRIVRWGFECDCAWQVFLSQEPPAPCVHIRAVKKFMEM